MSPPGLKPSCQPLPPDVWRLRLRGAARNDGVSTRAALRICVVFFEAVIIALLVTRPIPVPVAITVIPTVFRIADTARIEELILTGITPTPPNPAIVKVGRSKHRHVPWRYEKEADEPIAELKAQGYRVFALEITEGASPYYETDWPAKTCLVIGHEDQSITRATLALCDDVVFIPMWGKGLSLNVHVALAVAVFHIRYLGLVRDHSDFSS